MPKSINLLLSRKAPQFELLQYEKPILNLAMIVVALFILASSAAVILGFIYSSEIKLKKTTEREMSASLGSKRLAEGLYLTVFKKSEEINRTLSRNPRMEDKLNTIWDMADITPISIKSFDISPELHGRLTLTVKSADDMDKAINYLQTAELNKKVFHHIKLSGISKLKTGDYTLTVDLDFNRG